jgi:nucleotide-binding universal stress UspA family protein
MYSKILVATDGSEYSLKAAKRAADFSKQFGSKVLIFHSIRHHMTPQLIPLFLPPFTSTDTTQQYKIPKDDYLKIERQYQEAGKLLLAETLKVFQKTCVENVEAKLVLDDEPFEFVKQMVEREKYDLVIVGCKGHHSKLRSTFMGTVAQKIMNEVPCDVLIVR